MDRLHEDTKERIPTPEPPKANLNSMDTTQTSTNDHPKEKETVENGKIAAPTPPRPTYASPISHIFQGLLLSRIKCLKCEKVNKF